MRKHIVVIIGVGKLGARYLQGLLKISLNLDITCVDPSKKSLDYAQSLIEEEGLHLLEKIRFNIISHIFKLHRSCYSSYIFKCTSKDNREGS